MSALLYVLVDWNLLEHRTQQKPQVHVCSQLEHNKSSCSPVQRGQDIVLKSFSSKGFFLFFFLFLKYFSWPSQIYIPPHPCEAFQLTLRTRPKQPTINRCLFQFAKNQLLAQQRKWQMFSLFLLAHSLKLFEGRLSNPLINDVHLGTEHTNTPFRESWLLYSRSIFLQVL